VEIAGWRKEGFASRELDPPHFTIASEIRYLTQSPLTIQTVYIGTPGKPLAEYEIESVLAPSGEPVKITCSGEVEPALIKFYDRGCFSIVMRGRIDFTGCFGKEQTQPFPRACYWGPGGRFHLVAISELTTPIANPRAESDSEKAN